MAKCVEKLNRLTTTISTQEYFCRMIQARHAQKPQQIKRERERERDRERDSIMDLKCLQGNYHCNRIAILKSFQMHKHLKAGQYTQQLLK